MFVDFLCLNRSKSPWRITIISSKDARRSFKKWPSIHPGLKLWMCNIPVAPKHLLHKWQVLVPIMWQCLVSLFPPDKNAFSHGLYWDIHQPKVCSVFAHTPKPPQKVRLVSSARLPSIQKETGYCPSWLWTNLYPGCSQGLSGTCMFNPMFEPDCPIFIRKSPRDCLKMFAFLGALLHCGLRRKSLEIKS